MRKIGFNLPLIIFTVLFSCSIFGQHGNSGAYRSLLWEISGNGLDRPSFIYGTMHVSQKVAFHLGDPFYSSMEKCELVALELNPNTWMQDLSSTDLLIENYPETGGYDNYYEEAFRLNFPSNRELGAQLSTDDNLINGLLYRSDGYSSEFEESTYLDLYIFQTASRMGKEVVSLEDYTEVMDYSLQAMIPSEDDKQITQRKWNELFKGTSASEALQDAYRDGDLTLIDSISRLMNPSANFHKYMIDKRNENMALKMHSIFQSGKTMFTGVGAAHLPGKSGIIQTLRQLGYTLRPLSKGEGGKSKLYEEKYDSKLVAVHFDNHYFPDAFHSLMLPGKLHPLPSYDNTMSFLYPDMANGVYYWVKRIRTYDPLLGHSMNYTFNRIDSLLYENIPGEIVEKQKMSQNGVPGMDIVNRTRQGDYQRYRIFVTPLEILIFKMGGSGNYCLDYADKFIKNIKINLPKENNFKEICPQEGGFSVVLPEYHVQYRLMNGMITGGPGIEFQGLDDNGDYYLCRKTVLNDIEYIEEDRYELKQFVNFMHENERLDSLYTRSSKFLGYPSLECSFDVVGTNKKLHALLTLKGNEYFLMAKLTDESYENSKAFLQSLKFERTNYGQEFIALSDNDLGFTMKTVKQSEQTERLLKSERAYKKAVNTQPDDFEYDLKTRLIRSSNTGEEIHVTLERSNAFFHIENIDSLWSRELKSYERKLGLKHGVINTSQKDSIYELDFVLYDTLSTRRIKSKKIYCNRRLYTLQTGVDALGEATDFVRSGFDSFTLKPDKRKETTVFERKNELFFDYLNSGDSLKISRAFEFIGLIKFDDYDAEKLITLIDDFNFEHQGIDDRASLIDALNQTKSKRVIEYLENLYLANEDAVTYQLACLTALAKMNSEEATKTLGRLMVNNPTIPSEISGMNAIYRPLFDSLSVSESLFPDFIQLGSFPEYKNNNLNLLSALVASNNIKKSVLRKYKKQLINEGIVELKRQFASEEGANDLNKDWNALYKMKSLNYDLINYATIIAPWYKESDKVQKFFSDIMRLKNKKTLARLAQVMVNGNVPVSNDTWTFLAEEDDSRAHILHELEKCEKMHHFDKNYYTAELISFSQLISEHEFEDSKKDVEFIDKFYVESKENKGYYYFYKGKVKDVYNDGYKWALYYIGPQPINENKVNATVEVNDKSENIEANEDYQDLLKDILKKLEMKGRKRYGRQFSANDYGGLRF